jgi:hypothetical protein
MACAGAGGKSRDLQYPQLHEEMQGKQSLPVCPADAQAASQQLKTAKG